MNFYVLLRLTLKLKGRTVSIKVRYYVILSYELITLEADIT
jgi:hypothetical protein